MSVSVKKSCFDEHGIDNLDEVLTSIQKKQCDRKHVVNIENSHQLVGCFCGIKAVREELQQILKEKMKENEKKMKENQKQDEIRNKEKQSVNKQTMLPETNEPKWQNLSDKRPKTTTHFVTMDKDLYDYLTVNYKGELQALCNSTKVCETERGFAIEIELNPERDVEKIKNDISAVQNRFVVREHKVSEDIHFSTFKDKVMAKQKNSEPMMFFDSEQKTVKVIGSRKEADAIIQWILTLSASQHFDVIDGIGTKNAVETVKEKTKHPDKKVTITEETKRDEKKTLIGDTESECPDRKDATEGDSVGDDNKTPTDDTMPQHPDKQGTANDDIKDNKKALIYDRNSEQKHNNIKTKAETRGDDKKTLNDHTKSENPDEKGPTTDETKEDDKKTPTEDSKSYTDQNGTSKGDTMGYDKKTLLDDTKSEYPDKEVTTIDEAKGHDKNILIVTDNTKSESPTPDNTIGDDDKTLTDDATSEHQEEKGANKLDIKKINAIDTTVGNDSMAGGGEESTLKIDISKKGLADDKDKKISLEKAATKFSKTGSKSEYDNENQGIQSPSAAHPVQQPSKQRQLLHHISMDEDAYKYIQRFLHQEFEDLKALCNSVQELRDEASKFSLGYTVKYEVKDEIVRRRFQQLKDQVKVEEYKAPEAVNASALESVVHASAKSEGAITFVQSEKNSLKIVGRPDKVDKLKKHIAETVSEQLLSHEQLSKGNMHTYDSEKPCKQPGMKCYHHIPIDENLYTYISAHCHQEIEKASDRCTSITSSQKGSTLTIDFQLKHTRDEGFVKNIFKNLMGQFKSEECRVPKGIDTAFIQEMNTLKAVMIFPQEDKQLLKLIGPNTQVSKTKKWIECLISKTIESEQLSRQKPDVTNPSVLSSPKNDQPQSSRQSIPYVSTSLQKGNPVQSPRKPGERFKITSTTTDSLVYESKRMKNQLTVRVHYANIIKQNTDVLVSYEDEWLQGCTVLAIAMKEAAGPDVERELANISKNRGRLEVGQVVHTSAGKLRPSVKYVVHAVRPQRSQHHPDDPKTFEILYKTFLHCVKHTNDKICQKSISIPPLGSREYGVPLVSAAFFQAVEEYDKTAETTSSLIPLRSIHFVDHDPIVVKQMVTSMKSMIE